jgi:hypothetical protein
VLRQGWVDPRQLGLDLMLECQKLVHAGQPVAPLEGMGSSFHLAQGRVLRIGVDRAATSNLSMTARLFSITTL